MRPLRRIHAALLLTLVGCGGDGAGNPTVVTPAETVARVDVSPTTLSVLVGATGQLTAVVVGSSGSSLSGRVVTWSSGENAVATVSASGLVTGVAIGSTIITASSEGRSTGVQVTVTRPQVAQVLVSPTTLSLSVGATAPLVGVAVGAAGDTLPGRTITWTSANQSVATVSSTGLVTGVAAGTTQVVATSEGRSVTIPITVQAGNTGGGVTARVDLVPSIVLLPAGQTLPLTAVPYDSAGTALAGKAITFSSSNNAVASISPAGVLTAVAAGLATITATVDGKSGTSAITVVGTTQPGPVARVVVSPGGLTLPVRRPDQLTAVAYDSVGRAVPGAIYTWNSSSPGVATVTNTGYVNAVAAGSTTITATTAGKSATALVTVIPQSGGSVARVDITPATASVAVNSTVQLTGTARDAQGNVTTDEIPLWITLNPVVATVSPTGLVTGLAPGSAIITLSQAGRLDSAVVTVTGAALSNIVDVNPSTTYQTIIGWQGAGQNGWFECNATAFANYKVALWDRLVNELGMSRMTIALRSGMENTRDYHTEFANGLIDNPTYTASWFDPVNDNNDPFVADTTKFHWSFLDGNVDNALLPLRQRLLARGETMYFVLTVVDNERSGVTRTFFPMRAAEEYAEVVTEAFKHLQKKYGFVPDALDMLLEPEGTPYTPTEMGRALVAVKNRLSAAGFHPDFMAPSTTSVYNASVYYDGITAVPGARGLVTELAYHRYVALSTPALASIGLRAVRDGIRTSMTEHIGSGFDALYEDLTIGQVSSWMQFSSAFCGNRDNPDNQGVYYQINQTDPNNPRINITNHSKLLRQVFYYVRRGAVRIGAVSGNSTDLLPLAFRNANGKYVAVVRTKRGATFTVRGLPPGTYGINYGTTGAYNVSLADQTITSGGSIQATIPTDGVVTIFAR